MTAKSVGIIRTIVTGILGLAAGWSLVTENYFALLAAVVLAMVLIVFFNRAAVEVTRDERTNLLGARASRATIALVVPVTAVVSVVLIALKDKLPHDVLTGVYTLNYFCCLILVVQAACYSYFNRRS